jgi:hypothetical protein
VSTDVHDWRGKPALGAPENLSCTRQSEVLPYQNLAESDLAHAFPFYCKP